MDSSGIIFQIADANVTAMAVSIFLAIVGCAIVIVSINMIFRGDIATSKGISLVCVGCALFVGSLFTGAVSDKAENNIREAGLVTLNAQIKEVYGAETDLTANDIAVLRTQNAEIPAVLTRDGVESHVSLQKHQDKIVIKDVSKNYPTLEELNKESSSLESAPAP